MAYHISSIFSQSSASTASESASETESDPTLGSIYTYSEGLLHPYMGLLPVSRPDDPWTHKAYDPHHALYTGGGSYAAYLKDSDGRHRRDTHIMPQIPQQRSLLTPDMLERLLRIKVEFQRRFPHLYKTMLSHHTNQTRVEVQPPLLGIKSATKKPKSKYESEEEPVYELGAAERGLFEEEEEDQAEAETEVEDIEPDLDLKESQESSDTNNNDGDNDGDNMDNSGRKDEDDNELDYFSFDDDMDNGDDSTFVIPK